MRNRWVQVTLGFALLALMVQVVLIAPKQIRDEAQTEETAPPPLLPTGPAKDVDQSMSGMHMIETQEGRKEWELWSDRAVSLKTQELLELEKVKAVFFSDSGVTFTVTGEKGTVQVKSKDLIVEGNVVTRSSNGYVFRTQQVTYASTGRKLDAKRQVEMTGPPDESGQGLRLTGVGMEASLETGQMEVMRDVKAQKVLEGGRKALIRSHRALFSAKERMAQFSGGVVLDMDAMRITGPKAEFQYDKESNMVRSVAFKGGARVSDVDKWATAQNVTVDFKQNKFVFTGQPRVVQNNDELRGEEIVFVDGGKRVQVRRARAKVDEKRIEGVRP